MGILDWPLKDSRQPWSGKKIRRDFSLRIGMRDAIVMVDDRVEARLPGNHFDM